MTTPNRMTLRTAIWTTLGIIAVLPVLVPQLGLDLDRWPWLATVVAAASLITRVVNTPAVDDLLTRVGLGRGEAAPAEVATEAPGTTTLEPEPVPSGDPGDTLP